MLECAVIDSENKKQQHPFLQFPNSSAHFSLAQVIIGVAFCSMHMGQRITGDGVDIPSVFFPSWSSELTSWCDYLPS